VILWLYDTSHSELVYADPEAGPIRFPLAVVQQWAAEAPVKNHTIDENNNVFAVNNGNIVFNENALRKVLPRADKSRLVVPGVRFQ
jgi:hypothetical protein